jgi:hypothetical protein
MMNWRINAAASCCELILTGILFARFHDVGLVVEQVGVAKANEFYADCVFDSCNINQSLLCDRIKKFADFCRGKNIPILWRDATNCRKYMLSVRLVLCGLDCYG